MGQGLEYGKAYSHAGRIIQFAPLLPFLSVYEIRYDHGTNRGFLRGVGKKPFAYGEGADEDSNVSIKMSMLDYVALKKATKSNVNPDGNVTRTAPFDILLTDTHPQAPVKTVIKNFLLKHVAEGSSTDELDNMVELTGIATGVI